MLIWYANMPEETQFFMPRQIGPWAGVSLALVFFHLLIPLAGLLSRHAKRRPVVLTFWAVWLLAAHLLDLFWLIMPNVFIERIPEAVGMTAGAAARGSASCWPRTGRSTRWPSSTRVSCRSSARRWDRLQ